MCHLYVCTVGRLLRGYLLFVSSSIVIDVLLWYFSRQFLLYIKLKNIQEQKYNNKYNSRLSVLGSDQKSKILQQPKIPFWCSQTYCGGMSRLFLVSLHVDVNIDSVRNFQLILLPVSSSQRGASMTMSCIYCGCTSMGTGNENGGINLSYFCFPFSFHPD